jgi:hypothetical protein
MYFIRCWLLVVYRVSVYLESRWAKINNIKFGVYFLGYYAKTKAIAQIFKAVGYKKIPKGYYKRILSSYLYPI